MSETDPLHRPRAAAALFLGVAFSAMGYVLVVAFVPLMAEDLLGDPLWSGVPSALGTVGTAFGTTWLAWMMLRWGPRFGLVAGYVGAAAAATVAAFATTRSTFPLLSVAMFVLGVGYAASRLSRYAAADLYEPQRRSSAIGWNVWGATVGSVVGPLLLAPIRDAGLALHVSPTAGPFLAAGLTFAGAGVAVQLLCPPDRARRAAAAAPAADEERESNPGARLAIATLVAGQGVMVLLMTITPIHMRSAGHGLGSVGVVFASHTFGMYAVSPLAGILSDRLGRVPLVCAAAALLAGAGLTAATASPGTASLAFALFLLGLGWNFGYVAGSALLTESTSYGRRLRAQGMADSLVWASAAIAGVASGLLLKAVGFAALSRIAAVLALAPIVFVRRRPSRVPLPRAQTAS